MVYKIDKDLYKRAAEYGFVIEPSHKAKYKIDIYNINGEYLMSIGDRRYKDYWLYRNEFGHDDAKFRKNMYFAKYEKYIETNTRERFEWVLLWNGDI
jgi:hypothetical protein